MRGSRAGLFGLGIGLVIGGWPAAVSALEDTYTLGLGAGYALAPSQSEPPQPEHGAWLVASGSLELDGAWALRSRAAFSHHPGDPSLRLAALALDLVYLVDIIEVVPYFGTGLSVLASHRDEQLAFEPVVQDVLGIAYLVSFDLALELEAGVHLRPWRLAREPLIVTVTASLLWLLPE